MHKRIIEALKKREYFKNMEFIINSDHRAILTNEKKFVMNCHDYHFYQNLIHILKYGHEIIIEPCTKN